MLEHPYSLFFISDSICDSPNFSLNCPEYCETHLNSDLVFPPQSPPCSVANSSVQPGDSNPSASTRILNMLSASTARVMKERGGTTSLTPAEISSAKQQETETLDAKQRETVAISHKVKVLSPNGVPVEWQMSPGGGKVSGLE